MLSRARLALVFASWLLAEPALGTLPGSQTTPPRIDAPRLLGLHDLKGLSTAERATAFEEYVLAYRGATASGNQARARELAEHATTLWPERARPWLHLAATRLGLDQWGPAIEAARSADKAADDTDRPSALPEETRAAAGYWEGLALYRTQRYPEALPRLRAAHAALSQWAEGGRALGEAEFVAGHATEAAAAYTAAFASDPETGNAQDLSYWADARATAGDLEGGIAAMQEALRRFPFEPGLHAKLGDLLRREDQPAEAYYELVHELLLQGLEGSFSQPALTLSQELVKSVTDKKDAPNRTELLSVATGLAHLDAGETHAALHHLAQALALTRTASPVPRLLFADALFRDGQTERARSELQQLLAVSRDLVPALHELSEVETRLGHPKESEAALLRARTLFPTYWKLQDKRGKS